VARIRYIKPAFFDHPGLARLSAHARLAFQGLWLHADREGRLKDEPERLRVRVFPYEPAVDMDALLCELAGGDFLRRYEVEGVRYLYLPGFLEHQKPHPREPKSTIPECPAGIGRDRPGFFPAGPGYIPPSTGGMGMGKVIGTGTENTPPPLAPRLVEPGGPGYKRNLNSFWTGSIFDVPQKWATDTIRESNGRLTEAKLTEFCRWAHARAEREGIDLTAQPGRIWGFLTRQLAAWRDEQKDQAYADSLRRSTEAHNAKMAGWEVAN
jgi:hypothetical protein